MWCSDRRRLILLMGGALPLLAGCGFSPLYGEGTPAHSLSGTIEIPALPGRFGFDMRERLVARLGAATAPRYVLDVTWDIDSQQRAIRADRSITRFNLAATATYRILPAGSGDPLTAGTARAFTAYSAIASPFATRAAEEDALRRLSQELADRIVLRLSATAADWAS